MPELKGQPDFLRGLRERERIERARREREEIIVFLRSQGVEAESIPLSPTQNVEISLAGLRRLRDLIERRP